VGFGVNSTPIAPSDPKYAKYFGCGVVDAENALLTNPPPGSGDPPPPPPPPPTNHPPVAADDSATTAHDAAVNVSVLANDSDPDGDTLTIASVTQPSNGTAAIQGSAVRYSPAAGFAGSDAFTYTVSDGHGGDATATVNVTVTPPPANRPPVAANDAATTQQETSVVVSVLANDSDPDGDSLSVAAIGTPGHGTAAVEGSSVRYTPAAGYAGSDSFDYTVSDGHGHEATATVNVTVNAPPSVHVGDIDAFPSRNTSNWSIRIRVYVDSQTHSALQNVTVRGSWDNGTVQSCISNRTGYCEMSLVAISLTVPTRTFTITSLTVTGRTYLPAMNHDPDADSNGTSIAVNRP